MASFTDRMIGAAKFDVPTFEEVEADATATAQAMGVVVLSTLAGGIGGVVGGGFVVSSIAALIFWVTWAFLTYIIGARLLPEPQTHADIGQLMRTMGFAQSAGLLRVFGVIPLLGAPVVAIVQIWVLVAMVIGVRQALDYTSAARAVGVCVLGWVAANVLALLILLVFGASTS